MKLEKLLPEKKVWRDYHPQYECDYAWVAQEGKGYNQCRADCLAALEGKVLPIDDLPNVVEIAVCCAGYTTEQWASEDWQVKNIYLKRAQAIHDLIKGKAVKKWI